MSVFLNSGILMPAARFDDGPWQLDSGRILGELGFSAVADDDRQELLVVFGGALQRTRSTREFWSRWSPLRDGHPVLVRRLWNHVWRTFSVFYFYRMIQQARRRIPESTHEQVRDGFAYWETKLEESAPFLGGDAPDTVDLQLFGLVQMFASISGLSLAVLQDDPKLPQLRQWIGRMHRRFSSYTHLYSGPHFEPRLPAIVGSPLYERTFYWLGCALMWLAFPITAVAARFFARRVRSRGLQRP
jgi:hypothetical protein